MKTAVSNPVSGRLSRLIIVSAASWALAWVGPFLVVGLLFDLSVTATDLFSNVMLASPVFVGGLAQTFVVRKVYVQLDNRWQLLYGVSWVFGGLTVILLNFSWPLGFPPIYTILGACLGGSVSSLVLKWGLTDRNWEDTAWAIGGWVAGYSAGMMVGLAFAICAIVFAGMEDDPFSGGIAFLLLGATSGAVGAGALEWPRRAGGAHLTSEP